jgi:undecaprenyl diphosphate synthase
MDGNRRYARSQNQNIIEGHLQGGEKLMEVILIIINSDLVTN